MSEPTPTSTPTPEPPPGPSPSPSQPPPPARVGVVVIGRNEGERLQRCLRAAIAEAAAVVYVDSGSTDSSVAFAGSLGAAVVELDMQRPFTAARARNAGLARLKQTEPPPAYVQFLDGDCELIPGYLAAAAAMLERRADLAVVAGQLQEHHRDRSIYNRLCDMEWHGPIGEVRACGGNAMMRLRALTSAGGFREAMIAGEEPELCVRLRRAGWKLWRIDQPMARHDAAMTRFSQWWKRQVRTGHAYAEGAFLHGAPPERHNVKAVRSALAWGIGWPLAFAAAVGWAAAVWPWAWIVAAVLAAGPAALVARVHADRRKRGDSAGDAALYAGMTALGKAPTAIGIVKFHANRLRDKRAALIEYKDARR